MRNKTYMSISNVYIKNSFKREKEILIILWISFVIFKLQGLNKALHVSALFTNFNMIITCIQCTFTFACQPCCQIFWTSHVWQFRICGFKFCSKSQSLRFGAKSLVCLTYEVWEDLLGLMRWFSNNLIMYVCINKH